MRGPWMQSRLERVLNFSTAKLSSSFLQVKGKEIPDWRTSEIDSERDDLAYRAIISICCK